MGVDDLRVGGPPRVGLDADVVDALMVLPGDVAKVWVALAWCGTDGRAVGDARAAAVAASMTGLPAPRVGAAITALVDAGLAVAP